MSGETSRDESGWTVDTLKMHFDDLRQADKDALKLALNAADKANDKAETAQRVVNKSQNEFRGTLKDQAATLMPRSESEAVSKEFRTQLDDLKAKVNSLENRKQGAADSMKGIYAAIAAVGGILAIIIMLANGVFG